MSFPLVLGEHEPEDDVAALGGRAQSPRPPLQLNWEPRSAIHHHGTEPQKLAGVIMSTLHQLMAQMDRMAFKIQQQEELIKALCVFKRRDPPRERSVWHKRRLSHPTPTQDGARQPCTAATAFPPRGARGEAIPRRRQRLRRRKRGATFAPKALYAYVKTTPSKNSATFLFIIIFSAPFLRAARWPYPRPRPRRALPCPAARPPAPRARAPPPAAPPAARPCPLRTPPARWR